MQCLQLKRGDLDSRSTNPAVLWNAVCATSFCQSRPSKRCHFLWSHSFACFCCQGGQTQRVSTEIANLLCGWGKKMAKEKKKNRRMRTHSIWKSHRLAFPSSTRLLPSRVATRPCRTFTEPTHPHELQKTARTWLFPRDASQSMHSGLLRSSSAAHRLYRLEREKRERETTCFPFSSQIRPLLFAVHIRMVYMSVHSSVQLSFHISQTTACTFLDSVMGEPRLLS